MIAQLDKTYIKHRPAKAISRIISYALFEGRPVTTKGQWINPFISQFFNIMKLKSYCKAIEKPIFIIGTGRSGTTILGKLLSIHEDIGFLNEPKIIWHSIYNKEDVIGSYSSKTAYYRLDETHASEETKQTARRLFSNYLMIVGATRLVDKYPELIFRVPFVKSIFPDAKFIFLVRNGWDTCYSIKKWSQRNNTYKNKETHDWWGKNNRKWNLFTKQIIEPDEKYRAVTKTINKLNNHIDMAVVEWIATMNEGLQLLDHYSSDIHLVHYEELTQEPLKSISQIIDFCDLSTDNVLLSYAKQILKPVKSHPHINFHPDILPLFNETMQKLGY